MFVYTKIVKQNNVRNNGGNNMRIRNKRKFLRMIFICLGIIVFAFMCISNISFSKGKIQDKCIYVTSGDTLWSIAREQQKSNNYYSDKEIRQIVYEIRELNKLEKDSFLTVGQKLIVKSI